MSILPLICLVFALACFTLSAFKVGNDGRFNLQSAGLAFWVLSILIGK